MSMLRKKISQLCESLLIGLDIAVADDMLSLRLSGIPDYIPRFLGSLSVD